MENVLMFFFGLAVGALIGGSLMYIWLDYKFGKYVEEVRDELAEQLEGAFDE